jgi:hypothetical protein
MTRIGIADDGTAKHFDTGSEEILDMCLKRSAKELRPAPQRPLPPLVSGVTGLSIKFIAKFGLVTEK